MTPTAFHDTGMAWIYAVLPVILTLIAAAGSIFAAIRSAAHGQAIKDISDRQDRQGVVLNGVTSGPASAPATQAPPATQAAPAVDPLALLGLFASALHTTQDKTAQSVQQATGSTLEMNRQALLDGIKAIADNQATPAPVAGALPAPAAPVPDIPAAPVAGTEGD